MKAITRLLLLLSFGLLPQVSYALGDQFVYPFLYGALAVLVLGLVVALGTGLLTRPRLAISRWEFLFFTALALAGILAYWLKK